MTYGEGGLQSGHREPHVGHLFVLDHVQRRDDSLGDCKCYATMGDDSVIHGNELPPLIGEV